MKFQPTGLAGVFIIDVERHEDERGFFARTFCVREFEKEGLETNFVQCSVSFNHRRGTLRGMHYQIAPACETKLVRCTDGGIYDVVVDLRPDSPTFLRHLGVELTAQNRRALYIPKMFAHGFQTLADDTEVFYQISEYFTPGKSGGMRFDDPKLGLNWPLAVSVVNDKDRQWPLLA